AKRNGGQGVSTLAWCHGDTLLTVLETLKQGHIRGIREAFSRHGLPYQSDSYPDSVDRKRDG
ncbi:regulatory protein GemA, partial [Salmonella enterica subsp. enterica serovar Montevideo]|nr:regulatory protein GemA [Salmonella enterica subsp. enterica serovar Montevideo]